jgi:hypothetical protein
MQESANRTRSSTRRGGDVVSTFTIILIIGVVVMLGGMLAFVLAQGKQKK